MAEKKAVVLFSGGLDSTLAIRILQEQGFEIEALNIQTIYSCCRTPAGKLARSLGVRLTVAPVGDDYVELIRNPKYGYGKGMNPCIDCRIYMCRMAKQLMEKTGACLVATGEIIGQRPMSQQRWQQQLIEKESGLKGRLLRPLSAKLLPPTIPEIEGLVDREKLYDFHGRSRRPLVQLARELGIEDIPQPSTGCALTEPSFAPRVRDVVENRPQATRWDFEILKVGRHFRLDPTTKVVLGRNERENAYLERMFEQATADDVTFVHPETFTGPDAILIGPFTDHTLHTTGALILRYSKRYDPDNAFLTATWMGNKHRIKAEPDDRVKELRPL